MSPIIKMLQYKDKSGSPGILVCQGLAMPEVGGLNPSKGDNFYMKIKAFDNQTPVIYLAIRRWSEDLQHLIPST